MLSSPHQNSHSCFLFFLPNIMHLYSTCLSRIKVKIPPPLRKDTSSLKTTLISPSERKREYRTCQVSEGRVGHAYVIATYAQALTLLLHLRSDWSLYLFLIKHAQFLAHILQFQFFLCFTMRKSSTMYFYYSID